MTAPGAPGPAGRPSAGSQLAVRQRPELIIAAVAVAATAAAGYAVAGPGAFALVAVAAGVISLIVLRSLVRAAAAGVARPRTSAVPTRRCRRRCCRRSPASGGGGPGWPTPRPRWPAYEAGLRGQLEHLLASRLAERHGISLYDDPAAARQAFAGDNPGYDGLWPWIDPARPAGRLRPATSRGSPTGRWPASSTDWSSCDRQDPDARTRPRSAPPGCSPRCSARSSGTGARWNWC